MGCGGVVKELYQGGIHLGTFKSGEISQSPQPKYEFTDFPITVIFLQYSFNATYPQNLRELLLRHGRSGWRLKEASVRGML